MATITTKTISELNVMKNGMKEGMKFFIPAYQRGYRWTEQEVRDLLNDLDEFNDNNGKAKYCLQPLIVKKRPDGAYEVVDGQQRLTTIFIFMKIASAEIRSATPPFALVYETRTKSENFLNELSESSPRDDSNIDFHHISNARDEINGWLNRQEDKSTAIPSLNTKFRNNTQFIWYEIDESTNLIDLFTKVNVGKIPLTNAELIKALFMNSDNFSGMEQIEIDKRQTEIAMQWERIEQMLQDNSFWYFLTTQDGRETRMDFIFDILAERYNNKLEKEDKIPKNAGNYRTFLILNQKLKKYKEKVSFVDDAWKDAERLISVFNNWYHNLDVCHRIGWLVRNGVSVESIEKELHEKTKKNALEWLDLEIKKHLKVKRSEVDGTDGNDVLEYKNETRTGIRQLLLLFNLVSLHGSGVRFPFDKYTNENWDIEHIHAIKDKLPNKKDEKRAYFAALAEEFESRNDGENAKKLAEELRSFLIKDNDGEKDKTKDYDKQYEDWGEKFDELLAEDNGIGNLALLNADINRKYKNVTFFQKRKTILAKVKEGRFIPVCTQNVFLKLYASEARDLSRWNDADRNEYRKAIKETLVSYLS